MSTSGMEMMAASAGLSQTARSEARLAMAMTIITILLLVSLHRRSLG